MLLRLNHSGHYPNKLVEVTEEEYNRILALTRTSYLFDTKEGQDLLKDLESRPEKKDHTPTIIAYA